MLEMTGSSSKNRSTGYARGPPFPRPCWGARRPTPAKQTGARGSRRRAAPAARAVRGGRCRASCAASNDGPGRSRGRTRPRRLPLVRPEPLSSRLQGRKGDETSRAELHIALLRGGNGSSAARRARARLLDRQRQLDQCTWSVTARATPQAPSSIRRARTCAGPGSTAASARNARRARARGNGRCGS
jgi:hypothetical protein